MPPIRPVLFCVVRPLLHAKVYGDVAPLGVRFIAPLFNPQLVFVTAEEIVTVEALETVLVEVAVQLLRSVMVTVYVPAFSALISSVVRPLLQLKL